MLSNNLEKEFEKSLNKLDCGEVTLEFTTRAILNEAFRTPDIIKLFMSKRSDGLRQKLQEITRDSTIGKLGQFLQFTSWVKLQS